MYINYVYFRLINDEAIIDELGDLFLDSFTNFKDIGIYYDTLNELIKLDERDLKLTICN